MCATFSPMLTWRGTPTPRTKRVVSAFVHSPTEEGCQGLGFRLSSSSVHPILAHSPPETLDWDAISLSEAMVARDDIVFTPSIYGYATYAEADMRAPRPRFGADQKR